MMQTRSSFRKPSSNTATMINKINKIPLNAKGYPSVGDLSLRPLKRQPRVNVLLEKCTSLEKTAEIFSEIVETINNEENNMEYMTRFCEDIYRKLYDFVDRSMIPTFDEINAMLLVCRVLIQNKMKYKLEEFILNCPKKFILTYSNNSERTPAVLQELDRLGLRNIREYLISHIHESKLGTWNERRNTHVRGNDLLQCTI